MTQTVTARRSRARRGEGERLREEILGAARELLGETGSESAVSIRAVAERVGVTPPSIYLHFPDKEALLEAVCAEVFTALDEAMEEAAAATADPFEALRQRGLAYVRFALANPEHYRIVLMRRREFDIGPNNVEELAEGPAFGHVLESVRACQAAGVFDPADDPAQVALALWAAAHGVAALMISHPWLAENADALTERVIDAMGRGLAVG